MAVTKSLFDGGVASKLWLDRRDFYPDPNEVAELYSDITPFSTVMYQLETKSTKDPLYKIFEHESRFIKRQFVTSTGSETLNSSGAESNALTLSGTPVGLAATIDDSYEGLVCEVWDTTETTLKGQVMVTDAASSSTFKVKEMGGASSITTAAGDIFKVIYRARGEGSVAHEGSNDEIRTVWNSIGFFSDSCSVTKDMDVEAYLRGESNEMARLREEMLKNYKVFKEEAFLKSVSTVRTNLTSADTSYFTEANLRTLSDSEGTSGVVRTTYGFIPILTNLGTVYVDNDSTPDANVFNVSGSAFDFTYLTNSTEIIFDKRDSMEAFGFCGRPVMSIITVNAANSDKKFGWLGKVELGDQTWNKLGFFVRELQTPHGVIYLTPTKSLRDQYKKTMIIPNLDHIGIMERRADEYRNDVKKDNDYEGVKDVIKGQQGLWMRLLKTHHMFNFK
jgi:hypothetical protein